ncbi:solute carrier family 4 (anion exchanger), member 1, adaptor protein (predicted), isoform CRA_f [Rattus norvegicus]|uniref:Solute carrier family 4 (Anion exchanger), member 1, adaptor protein (Predicted), isoform CRA_f n=1 Tax=Rattus norvegicus TaxID=10116 RepID=A6HA50_RAT|nr:solute carrier family 4 (anion exchanger), member 1, adaptor protein (predicted), isoform CRA_f [Rattus norvegicus]
MLGEDSDEEDEADTTAGKRNTSGQDEEMGCTWGMGEELEYEFDEQGHSTWLCRVRLPVDDSTGKQLVAEAIHSGKKKEAMIQCSLEACRILDTLGLLRQEAVSRKRKAKNWEDEDFYDSDDDTFLDRTGLVEKKRLNRMKKAGKIDEKPETFESLASCSLK